jgi:peroxiredoxin Q/BCP
VLPTGTEAPSFELENQHGDRVALDDFDGWVVVYFYPRADTPGCTTEACGFRDARDEFAARNVSVVGISDDPVSDLAAFAEKHDLSFDLLSDESGEVAAEYDSYGEKRMFGRTFDGVFRNTYVVDPDGVVVRAYEDVSPENHAEGILRDLDDDI